MLTICRHWPLWSCFRFRRRVSLGWRCWPSGISWRFCTGSASRLPASSRRSLAVGLALPGLAALLEGDGAGQAGTVVQWLWLLKTLSARDSSGRHVSGANDISLKRRKRERDRESLGDAASHLGHPWSLGSCGPSFEEPQPSERHRFARLGLITPVSTRAAPRAQARIRSKVGKLSRIFELGAQKS